MAHELQIEMLRRPQQGLLLFWLPLLPFRYLRRNDMVAIERVFIHCRFPFGSIGVVSTEMYYSEATDAKKCHTRMNSVSLDSDPWCWLQETP